MNNYKENINEFRNTGLLLFINMFLHIFGWCIVIEIDDDKNVKMYPSKTDYRRFSEESQERAFAKITEYMKNFSVKE